MATFHGYAILAEVRELIDGKLRLGAVFFAAGLASPVLLVLAQIARQLERTGHGPVGLSTAPRSDAVAASRH